MKLNEKTMQKSIVVVALASMANLLWGSAAPIIKTGYRLFEIGAADSASQILFAGIRFFAAGILVILLGSIISGRPLVPRKSSLSKICVLALFQTIIQYVFFYIGCANTSGTKVTIVCATSAFIGTLISSLLFRLEKLTLRKMLGCTLGFAGVVLINLGSGGLGLDVSLLGEGFILISTCSFALSSAFTKLYSRSEDPIMLCGYQFILGGAVMIGAGLLFGGQLSFPGTLGLVLLMYLALLSAVAFSFTSILVKFNPVSRVAVFSFLNPMFGVTLSMLLLKESSQEFGLKGLVALVLVCLGVFIVNSTKKTSSGQCDNVTE